MIVQLFNSSLVSGPETLMIPAIPSLQKDLGEIQVWNLAEIRKGDSAKAPLAYAKSFQLNTLEIPIQSQLDFKAIHLLAEALERAKPSLVHAHDVKASIYLAIAARLIRSRVSFQIITTHHGIHARNGWKVRIYEWIYRFLFLRFFDAVLTVCSPDRDILLKQGFDPKKILVHLNGVDRPKLEAQDRLAKQAKIREQWCRDLKIDLSNQTVFGVAARLSPEKNHALLLESLSLMEKSAPELNWICICFGVGDEERRLKEKTRALGLEKRVCWAGYRKNLTDEMAGFDLLVSLSVGEGLPINLLEAAWSQTPILATAVDGVNDLLPENDVTLKNSRLPGFPSASGVFPRLEFLLRNPRIRNELGIEFQKRVSESFSGKAWEARLREIYQQCNSGPSR